MSDANETAAHIHRQQELARIGEIVDRERTASRTVQLLLDKAAEEKARAIEEIAEVDPLDHKRIIELQAVIGLANKIGLWIAEAIEAGDQAGQHLREISEENADAGG